MMKEKDPLLSTAQHRRAGQACSHFAMLAKYLTGCSNPQGTPFRPFCVSIHHPMGCPIPLGSCFLRFAFCFTTSWIAPFHKVVASIHLSSPCSPQWL